MGFFVYSLYQFGLVFCDFFLLGLVFFQYGAEILAAKNISEITYFVSSAATDWLTVFIRLKTHTIYQYITRIRKQQQRQAAREARIPINAGRLYN